MKDGFIKVAAASPVIKVADTDYNAEKIIESIKLAAEQGVKILTLPELVITGASCYDLLSHQVILRGAEKALAKIMADTAQLDILVFIGLPVAMGARIMSCAAAIYMGELLCLVPESGNLDYPCEMRFCGETVPVTENSIFEHSIIPGLKVSLELGEDIDAAISPAMVHAQAGATVIARLSSEPANVFSTEDALLDMRALSKRLCCGMVLACPGKGESSTDHVFTGLCAACENGKVLASDEGEKHICITEFDIDLLMELRRKKGGFDGGSDYDLFYFGAEDEEETQLSRSFSNRPYYPENEADFDNYCRRILDIQVSGLVKRMEYAGLTHCVVGISGGSDSTLATMVCAMALKRMGLPSENLVAVTMPCFGTSSRTRNNAMKLAEQCGAGLKVIDISKTVYSHFDDISHSYDDFSITFENAQARVRTMVLMDLANKCTGLNVGTEDMSEFIDGWCTFNGDHISMYDVNMGLLKYQVLAVLRFIVSKTDNAELKEVIEDVLACPITPELLPIHNDIIEQCSEAAVGPYHLQDFFTWSMLFNGFGPGKTLRLAKLAYGDEFDYNEMRRWLKSWCKRLFNQQFKRSVLNDGPAVNSFSVSPRAGFLMPSDAQWSLFVKELEEI